MKGKVHIFSIAQHFQAKLVAARNMIEKLKEMNIGIVNETLAAGVEVDHQAVHKKPVILLT